MPKTKLNFFSRYSKTHSESSKQQGFTLIELLVVVIVIAALSGIVISLVNSGGFRNKAKDTQRVSDLKQLQTALELYFADRRAYPVSAAWIEITGTDTMSNLLRPTYINKIPTDPNGTAGIANPCNTQTTPRYNYITNAAGTGYILTSVMAITSSTSGNLCTGLSNWGTVGSCAGSTTNCYGVQNP
jgi:prepilin-type N-terminal cleavage/methylation domain-containing protein